MGLVALTLDASVCSRYMAPPVYDLRFLKMLESISTFSQLMQVIAPPYGAIAVLAVIVKVLA